MDRDDGIAASSALTWLDRVFRKIPCPICERLIRERDLLGDGCSFCGTYIEDSVPTDVEAWYEVDH